MNWRLGVTDVGTSPFLLLSTHARRRFLCPFVQRPWSFNRLCRPWVIYYLLRLRGKERQNFLDFNNLKSKHRGLKDEPPITHVIQRRHYPNLSCLQKQLIQ